MSSGNSSLAFAQYTGNGGAATIPLSPGFQPKRVHIRSVEGEAVFHEKMPGVWKNIDGADPSFLASGLALTEFGLEISGSDDVLNKDATDYYVEMY